MKDIIITKSVQKRELKILLASLLVALLLNLVAIIIYSTSFTELYTQWIWMAIITAGIYLATVVGRLIFCSICKKLKR